MVVAASRLIQGIIDVLKTSLSPLAQFSAWMHFLGENVTVISPLENWFGGVSISIDLGYKL
ncbi:MAG: hypothetical protein ACJA1Z_001737 [Patiriisocius sp.]